MLNEILELFESLTIKVFVDGTLGAGGHARALLEAHPEIEHFIGIDQDPDARAIASERLKQFGDRVTIVPGNFRALGSILASLEVDAIDGMLLDLGVSSMQLDRPERGFSFRESGPLDMRMNSEEGMTAAELVNTLEEGELARILRDFGEEPRARAAARAIVAARPLATTEDLLACLDGVLRKDPRKRIHPATRVFQGLRIAVNAELDVIREVLPQALPLLRTGGRLAVMSFHSLEDRIVKRYFQEAASDKHSTSGWGGVFLDKTPELRLLTRKPMMAAEAELLENPRSRSAKLRAVEKL